MRSLIPASFVTLALAVAGCNPAPSACRADYRGNIEGSLAGPGACAHFAQSTSPFLPGDWILSFDPPAPGGVTLDLQIDVGGAPASGRWSPANTTHWRAIGTSAIPGCRFAASDASVPSGSFALTITSIERQGGEPVSAHGTLHVDGNVQAQERTDCGPGDRESIDLSF